MALNRRARLAIATEYRKTCLELSFILTHYGEGPQVAQ